MFTKKLGCVNPGDGRHLFRAVVGRSNTLVSRLYPKAIPRTEQFLVEGHLVTTLSSALVMTRTHTHSNTLGATK